MHKFYAVARWNKQRIHLHFRRLRDSEIAMTKGILIIFSFFMMHILSLSNVWISHKRFNWISHSWMYSKQSKNTGHTFVCTKRCDFRWLNSFSLFSFSLKQFFLLQWRKKVFEIGVLKWNIKIRCIVSCTT